MLIKIGDISFFCNNYQKNCAIFPEEIRRFYLFFAEDPIL